jgi:hypothetical protein
MSGKYALLTPVYFTRNHDRHGEAGDQPDLLHQGGGDERTSGAGGGRHQHHAYEGSRPEGVAPLHGGGPQAGQHGQHGGDRRGAHPEVSGPQGLLVPVG